MLILDKRKAVERIVALTAGAPEVAAEDEHSAHPRPRIKRHIATRERRVERAFVAGDEDLADERRVARSGERSWRTM